MKLTWVNLFLFALMHSFGMNVINQENCDDLIQCYLDVCNRALAMNKDRFPFKQILGAAQDAERDRIIEVDVTDSYPKQSYMMNINGDHIVAKPHGDCDDCQCDRQWSVTRSYLRDVVQNQETYIQNPANIDWRWMYG